MEDLFVSEHYDELYIVMELLDSDLHRIIQSPQALGDAHHRYFMFQLLKGVKVRWGGDCCGGGRVMFSMSLYVEDGCRFVPLLLFVPFELNRLRIVFVVEPPPTENSINVNCGKQLRFLTLSPPLMDLG